MKHIKVFAPGTVANLGCGFDIMGLTLDGVGDRIEVAAEAGASGLAIRNESGKRLPLSLRIATRAGRDSPKSPKTMS